MKLAVLTIAYNEEDFIIPCILNWKGYVDKHLVLVSSKPWHGTPVGDDRTHRLAKNAGAESILGWWATEAEQRNWGLARLYDYDYVLIVDPDEFYTNADIETIIQTIKNRSIDPAYSHNEMIPAWRVKKMITYWKTPDYVFDPPDKHQPIIAINPKLARVSEHRQAQDIYAYKPYLTYMPPIDVACHHMSWVKPDDKVREKIQSYSHSDVIPPNWYFDVWSSWEPGSDMYVRPYGVEKSRAIFNPAPDEIKFLITRKS